MLPERLVIAETLSCSPLPTTGTESDTHSEVECHVSSVVEGIPVSSGKLEEIKVATASNGNLQSVKRFIHTGWPEHISKLPASIREYVQVKSELSERPHPQRKQDRRATADEEVLP